MRVLTQYERKAFEQAFDFIDRVGCLSYETNNLFEIKVQTAQGITALPTKVISFIVDIGGLEKANQFFNGYAKEKTLDRFITRLMEKKEQPRDYCSEGVLLLNRIKVETADYVD